MERQIQTHHNNKIYHLSDISPLLNFIDQFRKECGKDKSFNIAKIVVVGNQSSGKTTVLESIIGAPILPKGKDTVTKCPMVIQLRCVETNENAEISFKLNEFCTKTNEKIKVEKVYKNIALSDLDNKIREAQEILLKNNGDVLITEEPMSILINKISAPNLTLCDTPGLVFNKDRIDVIIGDIIKKKRKVKTLLFFQYKTRIMI